jgi:hypothetical protein
MKRFLSLVFLTMISVLALGACKEDEAPDARLTNMRPDAALPDARLPDAPAPVADARTSDAM